jgi:hypothetical protein
MLHYVQAAPGDSHLREIQEPQLHSTPILARVGPPRLDRLKASADFRFREQPGIDDLIERSIALTIACRGCEKSGQAPASRSFFQGFGWDSPNHSPFFHNLAGARSMTVVDWLLDSGLSIRCQVKRDLLGHNPRAFFIHFS